MTRSLRRISFGELSRIVDRIADVGLVSAEQLRVASGLFLVGIRLGSQIVEGEPLATLAHVLVDHILQSAWKPSDV